MKKQTLNKRILITGGGSGGHISPAIGLIDSLSEKYSNVNQQILYVGGKLGMAGDTGGKSLEQKIFEKSDVPFIAIRGGKLQRSFSFKGLLLLKGVFGGIIDARKVINDFKPNFIFSTGGYVTVPVCLVAWLKKIPIYLHEQTAAVGLTNKIVSKFARRIYITFPQSFKYFPKAKTLKVGNIVRKKLWSTNFKGEVTEALDEMIKIKKSNPIILIAGGGQGSHTLNVVTRQILPYLLLDFQVIIQTGDNKTFRDYDVLWNEKLRLPQNLKNKFFPTKFINEAQLGKIYKNIDMYIGRSGANFVYELGIMRVPSILIPIPWVTHNEQEKNAKILVDCGTGLILPEGELTAEKLYQTVQKFNKTIKKGLDINCKLLKDTFNTDSAEKILVDIGL